MSVSQNRLSVFAKYIDDNHECLTEIARRMSIKYWVEFKSGDEEARAKAASKQDNLDVFISELQAILNENITRD